MISVGEKTHGVCWIGDFVKTQPAFRPLKNLNEPDENAENADGQKQQRQISTGARLQQQRRKEEREGRDQRRNRRPCHIGGDADRLVRKRTPDQSECFDHCLAMRKRLPHAGREGDDLHERHGDDRGAKRQGPGGSSVGGRVPPAPERQRQQGNGEELQDHVRKKACVGSAPEQKATDGDQTGKDEEGVDLDRSTPVSKRTNVNQAAHRRFFHWDENLSTAETRPGALRQDSRFRERLYRADWLCQGMERRTNFVRRPMSLGPRMFDDVGRSIKSHRLRALALGALAAVILLLIASTSFVAYLAASAPVVASYLAPNHPTY